MAGIGKINPDARASGIWWSAQDMRRLRRRAPPARRWQAPVNRSPGPPKGADSEPVRRMLASTDDTDCQAEHRVESRASTRTCHRQSIIDGVFVLALGSVSAGTPNQAAWLCAGATGVPLCRGPSHHDRAQRGVAHCRQLEGRIPEVIAELPCVDSANRCGFLC